ncbi:hypothetical protein [Jiella sp. M17.18]|uniref:hypothetical protein n=1 Tax=Jiella sp. M17.18 TaxID=3234247 RepID=UPI0034E038B1
MAKLLSDRLLALLTGEIAALEKLVKEYKPGKRARGGSRAADAAACPAEAASGSAVSARPAGPTVKERTDALSQLTRTLEKLLELKRLEMLAQQGGAEDAAETERLRAELLAGLRSLDGRRRAGPTLFDPETGAYAGEMRGDPSGLESG